MKKLFFIYKLVRKSSYDYNYFYLVDINDNISYRNNLDSIVERKRGNCNIELKSTDYITDSVINSVCNEDDNYLLDTENGALIVDELQLLRRVLIKENVSKEDNVLDESEYAIKYDNFNNTYNSFNFKYNKVANIVAVINQYDLCVLIYEYNSNVNYNPDENGFWDPYEDDAFITRYTFISKTENIKYCKISNAVVSCNELEVSNNKFEMIETEVLKDNKLLFEYKIYLNDLLYIHLILDKRIYLLEGLEGFYELDSYERDRTYDWKMMKLEDTNAYKNYLKYSKKLHQI